MKRTIVRALIIVLLVACIGYSIQLLDFSPTSIYWMPPQAPNLDAGYTVRSAVTSFVVSSADPWDVSVSGSEWTKDVTTSSKPVGDFKWKSYCTTKGTMSTVSTTHDTWQPLSTQTQSAVSGSAGEDAQFLMDYRIDLDWHDEPREYNITLTYEGTDGTPDTKTVDITLFIPTMQRLDVTGGFQWVIPTAADLNYEYLERSATTAFSIWTNQQDWQMTISAPDGWDLVPSGASIAVGDFKWRSHCITSGTMETVHTAPDTWTSLTTTANPVASGTPGGGAQFLMDYRIDFDWKDLPGDYQITPTYQLGDESKDVAVTITNPTIKFLDLTGGEIQWVEATPADLDKGYTMSSAGTSFVVSSNENWQVTVQGSGWSTGSKPVGDLKWKSDYITMGTMDTVNTYSWTSLTTGSVPVASGSPGKNGQFLIDYKVNIGWTDAPGTYTITLTYVLQGQ